ncbi:histidine kinase [Pedobacter steynii]|nr:histidine kinase [Pedobacter steynii]NQX41580.1 histidine kinase [Pedobacter steynii]
MAQGGVFNNPLFPDPFPQLALTSFMATVLFQSYTMLLWVFPLYQKKRKYIFWGLLFLVLLIGFMAYVLLIKFSASNIPIMSSRPEFEILAQMKRRAMMYFFFSNVFIAFYYFIDIYSHQKEIRRLEHYKTQKIALEGSFLKSQINPHFLFNTMNNIYALSLKKSPQTPVIIERLESLLHYMLYECKSDLVPLENEFTFTNSYIALEKLRHKEEQCKISIDIKGDAAAHQIAPLLLINFLENAFKHGTKTSFGKSWINMEIEISKKEFHFNLRNSKPAKPVHQAFSEYRGGIGLKNVKRRLEILYPRRHQLLINNQPDHFEIDLILNF